MIVLKGWDRVTEDQLAAEVNPAQMEFDFMGPSWYELSAGLTDDVEVRFYVPRFGAFDYSQWSWGEMKDEFLPRSYTAYCKRVSFDLGVHDGEIGLVGDLLIDREKFNEQV